jgi:hypothetical protein
MSDYVSLAVDLTVGAASFIGFLLLLTALLTWPAQYLWNTCLVGAIDGVHRISFMQAWGLTILMNLFTNGKPPAEKSTS